MDWENKFYSIVKETEDNLAKAKEKLSGKASGSLNVSYPGLSNSSPPRRTGGYLSPRATLTRTPLSLPPQYSSATVPETSALNMSAASGIQVLHMQEQIDSQNRTIERLQKLVRSLDNERDFYKEQISLLKDEVDGLTDKMSSRAAMASSERHLSNVKREVMHEIEKVKSMLQNYSREVSKRPAPSSGFDEDFWTVKDNLTESLELIRRELSLMNGRIDRMESQIASESLDRSRQDPLSRSYHGVNHHRPRSPTLYTPTYKSPADVHGLDVQQLRVTINSLNSKLDSLERRIEAPLSQQPLSFSSLRSSYPLRSFTSTLRKRSTSHVDVDDEDDLSSLSGLSDLSNLSDENNDDDIDALTSELRDGITPRLEKGKMKSSIYKSDRKRKGKVEFDLSDLDLSDVEDVDVDTDSLDLDN